MCANGSCVIITVHPDGVDVTDSKTNPSPVITYRHDQWQWLVDTIRAGGIPGHITIDTDDVVWVGGDGIELTFDHVEWGTFVQGVRGYKFDPPAIAA